MSAYFEWFLIPHPPCPHLSTFACLPSPNPVRVETNFEYNTENFSSKNPTLNNHLHHPSRYTNTKNVCQKVKYLLTTFIQNENIYLKISYGSRRKRNICFIEPMTNEQFFIFYWTMILSKLMTRQYNGKWILIFIQVNKLKKPYFPENAKI